MQAEGKRRLPVVAAKPERSISAEALFERFFRGLYPEDADLDLLRRTDANPANNPGVLGSLDEVAGLFAKLAENALGEGVELDFSDRSVHRLSERLSAERRDLWVTRQSDGVPLLVHLVTHGAVYVGACAIRHGGIWRVRSPLWESLVELTSKAGTATLSPFTWWLKALSDDEIGKGTLASRYRTLVEVPTFDASELAVIAEPSRSLPRLRDVAYARLHQYLERHVPELTSVGRDFPIPERLAEMAFAWMDFKLVGGGKMLVMYGPARKGAHVFWMSKEGFAESLYVEGRATDVRLEEEGDVLRITFVIGTKDVVHEVLWWGS